MLPRAPSRADIGDQDPEASQHDAAEGQRRDEAGRLAGTGDRGEEGATQHGGELPGAQS